MKRIKHLVNFTILTIFILLILIKFTGLFKDGIDSKKEQQLIERLDNEEVQISEVLSSSKSFTYEAISEDIKEKMTGVSWKEGSPVDFEDMAYVKVLYWGFDDMSHEGELIVNKKLAEEVAEIFKDLYESKYAIEKIRLIDEYDAKDDLSMANNNTSAYCFRHLTGNKNKYSKHSYGIAIDINPIQNPYIKNGQVLPSEGKDYIDRKNIKKGMIVKGDACYKAFKDRGWTWGGEWKSLKDYQHFEKDISNE